MPVYCITGYLANLLTFIVVYLFSLKVIYLCSFLFFASFPTSFISVNKTCSYSTHCFEKQLPIHDLFVQYLFMCVRD